MHPLVYGDYPAVMRSRVGARLPDFTAEQSKKLPGSFDFVGFNHYLVVRARAHDNAFNMKQRDYYADAYAIASKYQVLRIRCSHLSLFEKCVITDASQPHLTNMHHFLAWVQIHSTISKRYLYINHKPSLFHFK